MNAPTYAQPFKASISESVMDADIDVGIRLMMSCYFPFQQARLSEIKKEQDLSSDGRHAQEKPLCGQ